MVVGTWIAVGISALDQIGIWVPQLLATGHSLSNLEPASPINLNHSESTSLRVLGSHSWAWPGEVFGLWCCLRIASVMLKAELQITESGTGTLTSSVVVLRLEVTDTLLSS